MQVQCISIEAASTISLLHIYPLHSSTDTRRKVNALFTCSLSATLVTASSRCPPAAIRLHQSAALNIQDDSRRQPTNSPRPQQSPTLRPLSDTPLPGPSCSRHRRHPPSSISLRRSQGRHPQVRPTSRSSAQVQRNTA